MNVGFRFFFFDLVKRWS